MLITGKDVTDTIVQGSSRAQATPMEVFTAEVTPDDVPRVTVHTKEKLQDALEFLTAAVEAACNIAATRVNHGAILNQIVSHIHLTSTYPLNTQGFVEPGAIGHTPSQSTL